MPSNKPFLKPAHYLDDDDAPVGRLLKRREVLALFGAAGAAFLVGCSSSDDKSSSVSPTAVPTEGQAVAAATQTPAASASAAATAVPSCVVVPALTEGPYFIDENLNRSDIRSDPATGVVSLGTPLVVTFNVSRLSAGACTVLANAKVDVWHCDAKGAYSDVADNMFGNLVGKKFLRGYQTTDAAGKAQFTTIYPGWYQGRAVHVHFKIRVNNSEFTSQFFFDDSLSDQVFTQAAYQKSGTRLKNTGDMIYNQGGSALLLQATRSGDGYAVTFNIGLQI